MMYFGTVKEIREMNKNGLIREYKTLDSLDLNMEINSRMSEIMHVLIKRYGMTASEIESLEA
ncbi:MAG: hypothetical protein IJI87_00520 [Mogibacterium sp.]|nr:hypothetical protein [Mogibacterium sp.]